MFARGGIGSGLLVLGSMLVFAPLALLFVVVLRLSEFALELRPPQVVVTASKSPRTRIVRTVQNPPVKADSDETTEYVP